MCGIFAYVGNELDAAEKVLKGLKLLEYRGYDSWGVAFLPKENRFIVEKHVGKIGEAVLKHKQSSHIAVGHTRWATHGGVTVANAHPHFDTNENLAVVHNGIIENYQTLKSELMQKGYTFLSETDTEVAAYLIEDGLKNLPFREAVQQAFLKVTGLNAFVIVNRNTDEMIAVRNGSPLAFGHSKNGFYFASDATAMSEYTNDVYFLNDGELIVCNSKTAKLFEVNTLKEKKIRWQHLDFSAQDLSKGNFDHFMMKEIMEEPAVLSFIVQQLSPQIQAYAKNLHQECVFSGCGTAYYAALAATYFFAAIAQKRTSAVIGSELTHTLNLIDHTTFVTFLSQSGETIDIVESAQQLKNRRVKFGALVNRLGSTLERLADEKIMLSAGPEQCVLATKSFIAKIAILFLLAHEVASHVQQGRTELEMAMTELQSMLRKHAFQENIQYLAEKLIHHKTIFVIGRGLSYPMALEAALKIKEVTYIHAEGLAGGDLKHGVIALIEKGTPCIVLAPKDETYDLILSNAMELKSRGAFIIGLAQENNAVFDAFVPIKTTGLTVSLLNSVAMQLLAYHMAVKLGNDPDKPRNLAKSVTVK